MEPARSNAPRPIERKLVFVICDLSNRNITILPRWSVFQRRVVRREADFAAVHPNPVHPEGARACGWRPAADYTLLEDASR
jgi:hypothetical protein